MRTAIYSFLLLAGCGRVAVTQEPSWPLGHPIQILGDDVVVVADRVTSSGTARRSALDTTAVFREYIVRARVQVQICEDFDGHPGCRVPAEASFRIGLNRDSTGALCRQFLKGIQRYWTENPQPDSDPYGYAALPHSKYLFLQGGTFVLYSEPESFNVGDSYVLYTPGVLLRIELTDDPPRGSGALESLVEQNLRLSVGFDDFRYQDRPDISPRMLMQLIQKELISCPP